MVAGHLTVTYAAYRAGGTRLSSVPLLPLLVGAYLPDLVDKPLLLLFGFPARGTAHALLPLVLVFYLLYRCFPPRRTEITALALGVAVHLLEDWPYPEIILWPFLGAFPPAVAKDMGEAVWAYYFQFSHPYMLAVEAASWPACLFFLLKPKPVRTLAPDETPAA